jgi:hypothetical protein
MVQGRDKARAGDRSKSGTDNDKRGGGRKRVKQDTSKYKILQSSKIFELASNKRKKTQKRSGSGSSSGLGEFWNIELAK